MYKVEVGRRASKFVRKLDAQLQIEIIQKLRELQQNP